jgi:thiamine biosynthesis lipoprotein
VSARLLCLLIASTTLAACGRDARLPEVELSGGTMGTTFNIVLVAPGNDVADERLKDRIAATLDRIDALASTWRDDSELAAFNANPDTDWVAVSDELCSVVEQALELSRLSDGAFDITVGPLVNLWGFGPNTDAREPPDEELVRAAMAYVGHEGLETRCGEAAMRKRHAQMYIDLSGWAKGHAVDSLAELLDEYGLRDYLVEIGGELRVRGHNAERKKWAIAIEAPSTTTRRPHSVLRVTDTSVVAEVTVVNESAAFADAMATALLVLGPTDGPRRAEKLGIAAYFLIRNKTGFDEVTTPDFELLRSG